MSYNVQDLLTLLDLEPLEENIYRGQNRNIGTGRVFGGQVLHPEYFLQVVGGAG